MSSENLVALIFSLVFLLTFNFEDFIVLICDKRKINIKRGDFLLTTAIILFFILLYFFTACLIPDLIILNISRTCLLKTYGLSIIFFIVEIIISGITDLILKRGEKNNA